MLRIDPPLDVLSNALHAVAPSFHLSRMGALQHEVRQVGALLLEVDESCESLSKRMGRLEEMVSQIHSVVVPREARVEGGASSTPPVGGVAASPLSGFFSAVRGESHAA